MHPSCKCISIFSACDLSAEGFEPAHAGLIIQNIACVDDVRVRRLILETDAATVASRVAMRGADDGPATSEQVLLLLRQSMAELGVNAMPWSQCMQHS